jgi:cyclopropane fatty-acyl-phospholipid synthase-like methyltransferase
VAALPSPQEESLGLEVRPGEAHYRAFVGPPEDYDLVAAMSFGLLTVLGLRQHHRLLDVGCGSLRIGRLLIPYLNRDRYTGLEPNRWLVDEGIDREVGHDQIRMKRARFVHAESGRILREEGARYDYILAQSIFSHCGPDLLQHWLNDCFELLEPGGALVATYVEAQADTDRSGWIYPECVGFTADSVAAVAERVGLHFERLDWHHPRQQWALFARDRFPMRGASEPLTWNARFDRIDARRQPPAS